MKMKKVFAVIVGLALVVSAVFSVSCKQKETGDAVVSVRYYNEASDIVPLMLSGSEKIGLIPEPAATNLSNRLSAQGKTLYRLSLQELYDSTARSYPQAVIMVKNSLLATYPDIVTAIENGVNDSAEWLKTAENIPAAVNAIKGVYEQSTLSAAMSVSSIEGCNIYWQSATDAKTSVDKYIGEIRGIDESSANEVSSAFYFDAAAVSGDFSGEKLTFATPDGAPALGISKLIADGSLLGTGRNVEYKVVAASDIATEIATGRADIVIVPVNLATKKYQSGTGYSMVAVLTHGNFYIVSTEELSVNDLKDKTIAVPQRGKVPDWTLKLALNGNGFKVEEVS